MNPFAASDRLDALCPPPVQLQHRAHECADALTHATLPRGELAMARAVCARHPDTLGWADIRRMLQLYRQVFGTRV